MQTQNKHTRPVAFLAKKFKKHPKMPFSSGFNYDRVLFLKWRHLRSMHREREGEKTSEDSVFEAATAHANLIRGSDCNKCVVKFRTNNLDGRMEGAETIENSN